MNNILLSMTMSSPTEALASLLLTIALCLNGCQPSRPVRGQRIVSLVPSVTEIVYAVGAGADLVGNTNSCDWPAAARSVPKVGDFANPDPERIISLKPTLVFLAFPIHAPMAAQLTEAGIRWYASRPASLEDVFAEIETVGALVGKRSQAQMLAANLRNQLREVEPVADSPTVYLEIASNPPMTVGGMTFINDLVAHAGGRNVFANALQEFPLVDQELLIRLNPQVILILHPQSNAQDVTKRLGWSQIDAVRNGRVYGDLNEDVIFRPGPRIIEGLREIRKLLASSPFTDANSSAGHFPTSTISSPASSASPK